MVCLILCSDYKNKNGMENAGSVSHVSIERNTIISVQSWSLCGDWIAQVKSDAFFTV